MKTKLLISFVLVLIACGICYGVYTVENQNVAYIKRGQVVDVFENNRDCFNQMATFYETSDDRFIYYDSPDNFYYVNYIDKSTTEQLSENEYDVIKKICEEYSFNWIRKSQNLLTIAYQRPDEYHSVFISLTYDYDKQEWSDAYYHNYKRCLYGHLGYRIFDLIWNTF